MRESWFNIFVSFSNHQIATRESSRHRRVARDETERHKNRRSAFRTVTMAGESKKRKASVLEKTLNKYRHGQKAASKIMTAAARDRAALDARSDAQYERMKRAAEKQKAEQEAALAAMEVPIEPPKVVATNILAKQKHAIDTLFTQRRPMSNDELRVFLGYDCNVGPLFEALRAHEKVNYDDETGLFTYKAKHDVLCKEDILELVNNTPDGLAIEDVTDAYVKAKDDALALGETDDAVILLTNTETKKKVLFRKQPEYEVPLNEEFIGAFLDVEIPEHDVDFDKALRREGIEPTPRPVYDLGPQPELKKEKKKRKVNFERMNVTNVHMPELFKAAQVDRLDG
jgi:transcription initiation factor TFIIE subunit beta